MARCLSPAELAGLSQLFRSIDTDGNGTICVSELKAALEALGDRIQDAELQVSKALGFPAHSLSPKTYNCSPATLGGPRWPN